MQRMISLSQGIDKYVFVGRIATDITVVESKTTLNTKMHIVPYHDDKRKEMKWETYSRIWHVYDPLKVSWHVWQAQTPKISSFFLARNKFINLCLHFFFIIWHFVYSHTIFQMVRFWDLDDHKYFRSILTIFFDHLIL